MTIKYSIFETTTIWSIDSTVILICHLFGSCIVDSLLVFTFLARRLSNSAYVVFVWIETNTTLVTNKITPTTVQVLISICHQSAYFKYNIVYTSYQRFAKIQHQTLGSWWERSRRTKTTLRYVVPRNFKGHHSLLTCDTKDSH